MIVPFAPKRTTAHSNGSGKRARFGARGSFGKRLTAMPRTLVSRVPRLEVKAYPFTPFFQDTLNVGHLVRHVTAVEEGSGGMQRNGRVILGSCLKWRMEIVFGAITSELLSYGSARVIFFRWDDVHPPNVSDILHLSGGPAILSPYNYENAFKLKFLYDKMHSLNTSQQHLPTTAVNYAPCCKTIEGSIPSRWQMAYSGSAGLDQDRGAIYCAVIGSVPRFAQVSLTTQLLFTDM